MTRITVNGQNYPCRMTMGAMLRFKQETGRDVSQTDSSTSDLITLLWCCIVSACAADRVEFGHSLQEFADLCDLKVLNDFNASVSEQNNETKKKQTVGR